MIVTILQPSYISWRGYFHQIARSDLFIFYDDVQYDKHGWRNRNRIKTSNGTRWLTIPVHSAGNVEQEIPINQIHVDWHKNWPESHFQLISQSYQGAPFFNKYLDLIRCFYKEKPDFLADFTIQTTITIARELGISQTTFARSSAIPGIDGKKTDRLIQILKHVGASHYISGPSAKDYIEQEKFDQAGISLEYMQYDYREYPQLYPPYDPQVSILDLLFMTGPEALSYILNP
jgi:WbqC-like protein family